MIERRKHNRSIVQLNQVEDPIEVTEKYMQQNRPSNHHRKTKSIDVHPSLTLQTSKDIFEIPRNISNQTSKISIFKQSSRPSVASFDNTRAAIGNLS